MEQKSIKLVTLNIQKGWSLGRRQYTLDQIKKNVLELGVSVVCMQEVMGAYTKAGEKSQLEFLADGIWSHYAYGKNAVYSSGHHGNAILSERPLVRSMNLDISNHHLEKRGILHGVIEFGGNERGSSELLHVMTLHLDLTTWGRRRQVMKLKNLIEQAVPVNAPLIVCGDFNDWREELTEYLSIRLKLKESYFEKTGAHARTFPTFLPFLKLDRIYYRNLVLREVSRLDSPNWHKLSDHLGLYAEFLH